MNPSRSEPAHEMPELVTHMGENQPMDDPVIHSGYLGAIPGFWGDDDAPLTATLSFRVGEADERLGTRGRCHLLGRIATDGLESNVTTSISSLRTAFTVTGDDNGVGETLTRLTRAIATVRTDHAAEQAVELFAGWQPLERWDTTLLTLRFGCRGYGLGSFPLLGLKNLDVPAFSDWARTWFTAPNAVLSANRELPANVDLGALTDGLHKAMPDPHQVDRPLPAIAQGPQDLLAVSVLTRYDATVEIALELLLDRVDQRCKSIEANLRRPQVVIRRTGAGLATIAVAFHAPTELIEEIYRAVSAELFTFSMNGPDPTELSGARIRLRRYHLTPIVGRKSPAERIAEDHLFGEDRQVATALGAGPEVLAKAVRDLAARGIWIAPSTIQLGDHRLVPTSLDSKAAIQGQAYERIGSDGVIAHGDVLVAGSDGLSLTRVNGGVSTVRFADAVALEHDRDGVRVLWGDDGTSIRFDPRLWQSGDQLGSWLDGMVEPWIVIDAPGTIPSPSSDDQVDAATTDR